MATPKFYVKASSYSNINPYPTWKRDADYWEKDISNNLFYMSGNIGIGYPIPAGGLVVTTTIGIGTSTPQAALDVSGNVYLRDGTVTAPILSFNTDTNTGFYRPGNDTLGFVTGGSERMRIDASGNTSFTGNVSTSANIGIGTDNPTTKLDIMGNLAIRSNSYNTNVIYFGNGIGANQSGLAIYALESAPTSAWMINAGYSGVQYNSICLNSGGGNVGIGTITPLAKVHIQDTGAMIIPVGTTAQLPSTPVLGMVRFNIDTNRLQFYNQSGWVSVGGVSAIGGTLTEIGGYRIHTFTSSGTFTINSGGTVEYLIVAGGASGGSGSGGGGGGGGLLNSNSYLANPGTYTIVVGAGGGAANGNGINGGNSSIFGFIAIGGGGGGSNYGGTAAGLTGGSGGGGSVGVNGGSGTVNQGNAGGNSYGNSNYPAGGGGGAGAIGQTAASSTATRGGNGGNGLANSISGSILYYAGGGAGGIFTGGTAGDNGLGTDRQNSGGGGKGASFNTSTSFTGYDGIVIIRYLL